MTDGAKLFEFRRGLSRYAHFLCLLEIPIIIVLCSDGMFTLQLKVLVLAMSHMDLLQ